MKSHLVAQTCVRLFLLGIWETECHPLLGTCVPVHVAALGTWVCIAHACIVMCTQLHMTPSVHENNISSPPLCSSASTEVAHMEEHVHNMYIHVHCLGSEPPRVSFTPYWPSSSWGYWKAGIPGVWSYSSVDSFSGFGVGLSLPSCAMGPSGTQPGS